MNGTTVQAKRPGPSWRRVRYTPLRDILRGRVTGRLDLEAVVVAHALPAPLGELVLTVARRTRLWRLERADVAAELSSHFGEGLECGATADTLVESFGDPQDAARLIRRAKKRARPKAWKCLRFACFAVLGLIGFYVVAGLYFLTGQPDPSTDFRPRVNAVAASIPHDERAWPLYRTALVEGERPKDLLSDFDRTPRPGEDGWTDVVAYLERNEDMLRLLRETASRTGFGFIVGSEIDPADLAVWPELGETQANESDAYAGTMISYRLPYLAELRSFSNVLAMDMHRAAESGDGARVLADVDAIIAAAGFVRETRFIINDLVGFSMLQTAFDATGEILTRRPEAIADAQLVLLAHRLSQLDSLMTIRFDGERMCFADVLQWTYTDDGAGDGRFTLQGAQMLTRLRGFNSNAVFNVDSVSEDVLLGLSLPALDALMLGRREMQAEHSRLIDEFERRAGIPLWEREACEVERAVETWAASPIDRIRRMPLVLMMPAMSKALQNAELLRNRRDAVLVAVCLELHRRRTGSWPGALEELVPGLLPAVPPDRFDGKPMRYLVGDDGPLLYSVGTNRIDDGGVTNLWSAWHGSRWLPPSRLNESSEGDWILWPTSLKPIVRRE